MKQGAYPEFTVPGYAFTNSKGLPTSIKLFFDKKTMVEVNGDSIEFREEGQSKGPEKVLDFWEQISKISIPEGRPENQVKFRSDLRDEKGRFVSKARQSQVIQDLQSRGINWNGLSAEKQAGLFKQSDIITQTTPQLEEFDRTTIRKQIFDAYQLNPNYLVEIVGTDTKSRAYTDRETALKAIDQQLNKFYQGGEQLFKGKDNS